MIVENVYTDERREFYPLTPGRFRMSGSEMCPRRLAYQQLKYEPDSIVDEDDQDRRSVTMQDGDIHELDMVRRILGKGYQIQDFGDKQALVNVRIKGQHWRGRPDMFVKFDDGYRGLELKAFRAEAFNTYIKDATEVKPGIFHINDPMILAKRPWPVMGQVQLNLFSDKSQSLGIEEWIVVMKNKNTAELAECIVPKMPDYLDNVVSKFTGFWTHIKNETLPRRYFDYDSTECSYCPYKMRCWLPIGTLPPKFSDLSDNEEAVNRLVDYQKHKKDENTAKALADEDRMILSQIADEEGISSFAAGKLKFTASTSPRESVNADNTRSLLAKLLEQELITTEEYKACFNNSQVLTRRVSRR